MNESSIGVIQMTVEKMVERISKSYISLIENKVSFKKFPSLMLWGAPGVGKSQGVRQIGEKIQEKTCKKVVITDVRLLLFNPVDLRGIPTSNAEKTLAVWLKPKIFQMDESEDVVNILFLDEISAAPQSVQASAYQITLDRTVGEHTLPENCIVIAAGNRVTDRSVAYTMPKALANRLCHMEIVSDHKSWHNWAVKSGVNKMVLSYIDSNPCMLMDFESSKDEISFPTPRSWEMVSNVLNYTTENVIEAYPVIAGCIGEANAYRFMEWCEVFSQIPSMSDIFNGKADTIPRKPEILFALSSEIVEYARNKCTLDEMKRALRYIARLPREFANRIYLDLLQFNRLLKVLKDDDDFDYWFLKSGRDWEDYNL